MAKVMGKTLSFAILNKNGSKMATVYNNLQLVVDRCTTIHNKSVLVEFDLKLLTIASDASYRLQRMEERSFETSTMV